MADFVSDRPVPIREICVGVWVWQILLFVVCFALFWYCHPSTLSLFRSDSQVGWHPFVKRALLERCVSVRSDFIIGMLLGFDCLLMSLALRNVFVNQI